jgi:hypothetical protein
VSPDGDAINEVNRDLETPGTWRRHFAVARDAVPRDLSVPDVPAMVEQIDARFVAPTWHVFSPVLHRYLAGRLFGSWVAYQGRGLRTIVASLACALSIVRIEANRECLTAGRNLDAPLLTSAIRQADLLLVHKADRQELAEALSLAEDSGAIAGRR